MIPDDLKAQIRLVSPALWEERFQDRCAAISEHFKTRIVDQAHERSIQYFNPLKRCGPQRGAQHERDGDRIAEAKRVLRIHPQEH